MITESLTPRGSFLQGTLRLMQGLVEDWAKRPLMVQLAREVVRNAHATTPREEAAAIHRFVRRQVDYRQDPVGAEWVQDPFETLVISRAGDCDDLSVACGTLLQALGHPCRMAAVKWVGRPSFSHAVCLDKTTRQTVDAVAAVLEPWPPAGWAVESILEAL
jgi:transglutaminase-like putative cysteine protease